MPELQMGDNSDPVLPSFPFLFSLAQSSADTQLAMKWLLEFFLTWHPSPERQSSLPHSDLFRVKMRLDIVGYASHPGAWRLRWKAGQLKAA